MLFVMPVSDVTADGMVNLPGLTSVLKDDDGSKSDCAASSMIRLFSLLKPVVSKSKTMTVGNSDESLDTAGAFFAGVFCSCDTGDDDLDDGDLAAPAPRVDNTDEDPLLDRLGALGGVHPRGATAV
jgi:hypothetical protein